MQLSKVCVRSSFKRLARVALCLLLCVTMLGTTGVFGAVQAFADEPDHRYELHYEGEYTEGEPIPYGHVVKYIDSTGAVSSTPYLYKVVTASGKHWGHGSENDTKLYFIWHTATGDTDYNRLEENGTEPGDVYVIYDSKAHYKTKRTAEGIDTSITDYVESYVTSTDGEALGGAIYNETSDGHNVTADFLGNYAKSESGEACGGAIYNFYGSGQTKIGNITGDFLGNYAKSEFEYVYGGAIYNYDGILGNITGDFVGNYAESTNGNAYGGAIYNRSGTITSITGDFLGNYAKSTIGNVEGGAIYNYDGILGNITGDFLGNYAKSEGESSYVYGGAIYNINGQIGAITGDFIGNYAKSEGESSYAWGGAICNEWTIGDITGDFVGNYASGDGDAYGGAIYNYEQPVIGDITGDFLGNYAKSESHEANGGAIYNSETSTIGAISGNFKGNYAKATSADGDAKGGAIYSFSDITLKADGKPYVIQGNYVQIGNGAKDYQAIYMESGNLTFDAINGGSYTVEDKITGTSYGLILTGDKSEGSAINLHGEVSRASGVEVSNTTAKIADYVSTVTLKDSLSTCNIVNALNSNVDLHISSLDLKLYGNVTDRLISFVNGDDASKVKVTFDEDVLGKKSYDIGKHSYAYSLTQDGNDLKLIIDPSKTKVKRVYEIVEGTKTDYNYKVFDKDGNVQYKKINIIEGNIAAYSTSHTTFDREIATGDVTGDLEIKLPNNKTQKVCYAYTNPYGVDSIITSRITNPTADVTSKWFKESSISTIDEDALGGAIYNDVTPATAITITSDFTGNNVSSTNYSALGGAIYNGVKYNEYWEVVSTGTIASITGDFLGNHALLGGAILNEGQIGNITGNFIVNHASSTDTQAEGGAITNGKKISNITGDFLGNYAKSTNEYANGGAIHSNGQIGNITGDFIDNHIESEKKYTRGGAIYNVGTITSITGDFIDNHASSTNAAAWGGAIYNGYGSLIGNITGDFIANYAEAESGEAYGGAIFNLQGKINNITGDFIANHASGSTNAKGGAIYNDEKAYIGNITGDFIDNFAEATGANGAAYGGAIYNSVGASLKVTTGERDIVFSGNYVSAPNALGGAIYNGADESEEAPTIVQLCAESGKSITFVGKKSEDSITNGENIDEKVIDSVHNEGTLYVNKGAYTGTVNFASVTDAATPTGKMYIENGTVNFSKDVTQANIYFNGGYITMNDLVSSSPAPYRTLNIKSNVTANGGTFVIKTDLKEGKGDQIILSSVSGEGSNEAYVQVAYDPFYDIATDGETQEGDHVFLTVKNNSTLKITAKETLYSRKDGYKYTFTPTVLNKDKETEASDIWKIVALTAEEAKPTPIDVTDTTKSVSDTANAINLAWLETTNNLQKRLGDLRGGEASNTGWVRFQRSLDDLNNGRKLNVSGNLYQIGYDFALKNDTKNRSYLGLSLEHFDGNESYNIGGGDLKSTTVSAYYTKIYNSGHYFDFIFRYGRYESDTTSYDASLTIPELTKLDYALNGVTLSGEYGYRANIGKSGLYLEPQAEFIYGYLGGASKTSSTGVLADIDSTNHFVTRLGLAIGQRVKKFNYYLRGSYYHDFAGSTNITYGDASYKQDSAQNWWEVSLGGGWNISNTSYFYAEFTKHFKDVSNSLNFNLGFRFTL